MKEDQHSNIIADSDTKSTTHTVTLNTKMTRSHNLVCVEDKLTECKNNLLQCMADNITDQTKEESISRLMCLFDLLSHENFESRVKKVELLYDIYGLASENVLEN